MERGHSDIINVANFVNDGRIGGPQRRIVQIARGLHQHGVETIMFFPYMGEELPEYLENNGVSYVNLDLARPRIQNPILSLLKYLVIFPYEVIKIWRALRRHSIDLVHVNGPFTLQPLVAARLAGLPAVWHLNDTTLSTGIYVFLKRVFGWLASIRAYSSERVLLHYRDERSGKATLLYPPVDMERFRPAQQCEFSQDLVHQQPGELVLITVGNVNPTKGYSHLIEALAGLRDFHCRWRLLIVGAVLDTNSKYYAGLEADISRQGLAGRIVFTGASDDIPGLLGQSDIFVLSSVCEAGPMVLLEAMACGLPVVATDVGFVHEVIVDGENGLIVPVRNPEQLAVAIKRLLVDDVLRNRFADAVRNSLQDKFSVGTVSDSTLAIYRKLV